MTSSPRACPKCGRVLKPSAPEGLCSKCLLASALNASPASADDLSAAAAPAAGTARRFGDYELIEELGRGGMGIVYRARQTSLNRPVALKLILSGEWASPAFVERFRTEAEAAASLDHPNIVPLHEVGEHEGQHYFSMKLIEGGTLAERLARGRTTETMPFDLPQAAAIIATLARAVHYAHQRGILHRDLKPANILIDRQGRPYLTDFGLAKLIERESQLTHTLAVLGTPAYISPEQAAGQTKNLTTTADVYGLGAVFYELLTGQPPFSGGTTMETIRQVLELEPRRPSLLNPQVDRDLETICLKCLEKEPLRRYGSAEALALDLERWQRREPIDARPIGSWERLRKWGRRRPALAALIATVITAFATILGLSTWMSWRVAEANQRLSRQAEESRQQLVRFNVATANRLADEGDAFSALLFVAEAARLDAEYPERQRVHQVRFEAIQRSAPRLLRLWFYPSPIELAEFSPDGQRLLLVHGDKALILDAATGATPVAECHHEGGIQFATFSPDGRILLTGNSQTVQLRYVSPSEFLHEPIPNAIGGTYAGFSPDGQWWILAGNPGAQRYHTARAEPAGALLTHADRVYRAVFSPDSKKLLTVSADTTARVWDAQTGEPVTEPLAHKSGARSGWFSPDGEQLVTMGGETSLSLWNAQRGQPERDPIRAGGVVRECIFRKDGRQLYVTIGGNYARVWDIKTGNPVSPQLRHQGAVNNAKFTADGRSVGSTAWDNTARVWDAVTGNPLTPWLRHSSFAIGIAFNGDGQQFVTWSWDGSVRLWQLPRNQGAHFSLRHRRPLARGFFLPRGGALVTLTADGVIQVWDSKSGQAVGSALEHRGAVSHAALHSNGRLLTCGDAVVRVWDLEAHRQIGELLPHPAPVRYADFSPAGDQIATACEDGAVRIWNWQTRELAGPVLKPEAKVSRATFSPEGDVILTVAADGTARLWDAKEGRALTTALRQNGDVQEAHFSPDGRRVIAAFSDASLQERAAHVWDRVRGEWVGPALLHRDGVFTARFSPDQRWIATGSEDYTARLWDAGTHRSLALPLKHSFAVDSLAFSPDARLLATGCGRGGEVRVWDTATGEAVTPVLKHPSFLVGELQFSPDGSQLLTMSGDRTARVWEVGGAPKSAEMLAREAQLLAAHRLDTASGLVPLDPKIQSNLWHLLRQPSR